MPEELTCLSCVAAGVLCGLDNVFANDNGFCELATETEFPNPNFDFTDLAQNLQMCLDICTAVDGATVMTFRPSLFFGYSCQCYKPKVAPPAGNPCFAEVTRDAVMEEEFASFNICSGARSSAELLRHACLTCVISLYLSRQEYEAHRFQSIGAGTWGLLLVSAFKAL